jgi:DNA-binding response OmpR family regulator
MSKVALLIDDSASERAVIASRLERKGYDVVTAADGREGLRSLYQAKPDVVLLDVMMPGVDGWTTLGHIRELTDVPVIMVTGRDSESERVRGLLAGADDYVVKPYSTPELIARIEAVLRRTRGSAEPPEIWDDGDVRIDFAATEVRVRGEIVSLTPLEFRLLTTLTRHAGNVLSREQLLALVWGDEYGLSLDQPKLYIGYLRRKIEPDPGQPELIETVRGFGYRYRKLRAAD